MQRTKTDDLPLFSPPATRSTDPATSKAAAASVRKQTANQARIVALFKTYGDMTDEQLAKLLDELAEQKLGVRMSPSSIRSRRSELAKPNMERLDEMAREHVTDAKSFADLDEGAQGVLRIHLRREGFRSPLWDTGKRETMSTGRQAIVWGIAR